jgi:hypothetical protein
MRWLRSRLHAGSGKKAAAGADAPAEKAAATRLQCKQRQIMAQAWLGELRRLEIIN